MAPLQKTQYSGAEREGPLAGGGFECSFASHQGGNRETRGGIREREEKTITRDGVMSAGTQKKGRVWMRGGGEGPCATDLRARRAMGH